MGKCIGLILELGVFVVVLAVGWALWGWLGFASAFLFILAAITPKK